LITLFHPQGTVIAEISSDRVVFKADYMEKELKLGGIAIPYFRENDFGTRLVDFDSPDFPRAFKEIYCDKLLKSGYFWKKVSDNS
jgi:hypothetical protein